VDVHGGDRKESRAGFYLIRTGKPVSDPQGQTPSAQLLEVWLRDVDLLKSQRPTTKPNSG
jgi:hypothetical protein